VQNLNSIFDHTQSSLTRSDMPSRRRLRSSGSDR